MTDNRPLHPATARILTISLFVACILIFATFAHCTITVNAPLVDLVGSTPKIAKMRLELTNCGANVPQVPGATPQVPVLQRIDLKPGTSAAVYANNEILCGGVPSSLYHVTLYADASTALPGDADYMLDSTVASNWSPATAQPFTGTRPPPGFQSLFANPVANQHVAQPAGTLLTISGDVDVSGANFIGFHLSSDLTLSNPTAASTQSPKLILQDGQTVPQSFTFWKDGTAACVLNPSGVRVACFNQTGSMSLGLGPTQQLDVATKGYVDAQVQAGSGSINFTSLVGSLASTQDYATAVTPGTYPKLTVNQAGRITAGLSLSAGDIPNITESQVSSLTTDLGNKATKFNAGHFITGAITGTKCLHTSADGLTVTEAAADCGTGSGTWNGTLVGNATISGNVDIGGTITLHSPWSIDSPAAGVDLTPNAGHSQWSFDSSGRLSVSENGAAVYYPGASSLPSQGGNSGKVLGTNGTTPSWVLSIPDQTSNAGKVLGTNGTTASWVANAAAGDFIDYQKQATAVVSNLTTPVTLFTTTLPAGVPSSGRGIRVLFCFQHSVGITNTTYLLWLGSTSVAVLNGASTGVSKSCLGTLIFNDPGSTTVQQLTTLGGVSPGNGVAPPQVGVAAENTATGLVVKLTATANTAGTDSFIPIVWSIQNQ